MFEMGVMEVPHWLCSCLRQMGFCTDFHKVNEVQKFDAFPVSHFDELVDWLDI